MKPACLIFLTVSLLAAQHNVRDYGAKGDGLAKDTAALQAAVDAAAKRGGGVVIFPPGKYLSGTVRLKGNVTIELTSGARLIASPDESDFAKYEELPYKPVDDEETTYFRHALLTGEGLEHVTIRGQGTIDGNRAKRGGPKPVALKNSTSISIRDISIVNAPNHAISMLGCERAVIDGVNIENGFSGGIVVDCSRFVRISGAYVDSWNDAVCLKSSQALGGARLTGDIVVMNSVLRTNRSHIKMGTESRGGFKNIAIGNCTLLGRDKGEPAFRGIAVESVDGAEIEGISFAGIAMRNTRAPIFVCLGDRGRGMSAPTPGFVRNISISNIVALGSTLASSVTGLTGHPVQHITLSDVDITTDGGGRVIPLDTPELPAHSLYVRHAEGLTLRNYKTRWSKYDARPAAVFVDVRDLELHGFRSNAPQAPAPLLWFHNVVGALLAGSHISAEVPLLLRVSGGRSKLINVIGNDLRLVKKLVAVQDGAEHSAVTLTGNVLPGRIPGID